MIIKGVHKVCLILILLGFTQLVYAQRFSPDYWHEGGVVFKSGDTLRGSVYYTLSDNSVQLEDDQEIKHFYKAFKLNAVFFKNALDSTFRTFHVYSYKLQNGYEQPQLFEALYQDSTISLLGREKLMFLSKGPGFGGGVEMGYDFYLRLKTGIIIYGSPKKKEFLNSFPDEKKRLTDFIKKQKTDFDSLEDVKALVVFYNLIKQK